MRRRGPPREFSELRTCSGKRTAERCKVKGDADNVVFIDLEDEDVIDIDHLESLQPQSRGSSTLRKDREFECSSFINIDDDEDSPVITVEDDGDLNSDATSSKSSFPASNYRQNSSTSDNDECQVVQEKGFASRWSKCKETHSGKASGRNRYGLSFESESGSSDNDYSDCELIEGSYGKLHAHWEKASQKRKHVVHNGQSSSEDQVSGSGSHSDTHANAEVENRTAHAEVPVCSSSKNGDYEKENLSDSKGTRDGDLEGSSFDPPMDGSFAGSNQKVAKGECLHRNDGREHVRVIVTEDPVIYEWQSYQNDGISSLWDEEERSPDRPSFWSKEELGGRQSKHTGTCSMDNARDETQFSDSLAGSNNDKRKASVSNEGNFFCKNQHPGEMLSDHGRVEVRGKDHDSHYSCNTSFPNERSKGTSFEEKDKTVSGQPSDETDMSFGAAPSDNKLGAVHGESLFCRTLYEDKSEISNEKSCSQEKKRSDSDEVSVCKSSCTGTRNNHGGFQSATGKESYESKGQLQGEDGDVSPVQRDIITDREKLKETAEYKRAIEEEMASRQRVLQIQAEEAQRLRKRKKAESMRILDMQRRQKQRVEEVRETQKKDEENLNLKDRLRAEIRKELNRLELRCIDMASLLRGLGIQVGASFRPLQDEVHAAYKKALLRFHPDRASRTDIRQQVESEEKFKLISRMKEKLLLTC